MQYKTTIKYFGFLSLFLLAVKEDTVVWSSLNRIHTVAKMRMIRDGKFLILLFHFER